MRKLFFFIFALIIATAYCFSNVSPAISGGYVTKCAPCKFQIAANQPSFHFVFQTKPSGENASIIDSISVMKIGDKSPLQSLYIDDMDPVDSDNKFFFDAVDINFDNHNDLLLIVSRGIVNSYGKYWVFNPKSQLFDYLGEYAIFKIDKEKHSLTSYEKGGHGGMIFESKEYVFKKNKLSIVRQESQKWDEGRKGYSNIIKRIQGGKLMTINETFIPMK